MTLFPLLVCVIATTSLDTYETGSAEFALTGSVVAIAQKPIRSRDFLVTSVIPVVPAALFVDGFES